MKSIYSLSFVILLFNLMSCNSLPIGDEQDSEKWIPWKNPPPPLEFTVELNNNEIFSDSTLQIKLNVTNTSSDSVELHVSGGTDVHFEFVVTKKDCTLIWNRLPESLTSAENIIYLAPNETVSFEDEWNLTYSDVDIKVQPGNYLIFGGLVQAEYTDPSTSKEYEGNFASDPNTLTIK